MHQNQITSQWYFLLKYIYYLIRLVDLLHFHLFLRRGRKRKRYSYLLRQKHHYNYNL